MKTVVPFFLALFLLTASSLFAQERKTVFEAPSFAKAGDGSSLVNLTWKKGTENTAYYLVQRSIDGVEFKTVGLVFTSEDNNFSDYAFRDKVSEIGGAIEVYYRVGIVSDQKELTYLPVKKTGFVNANFKN